MYQSEIKIPDNVFVEKKQNILKFSGPLGFSKINLEKMDRKGVAALFIKNERNNIYVLCSQKDYYNSIIGLIKNKIYGVSQGFLLYLRIVGIGYRCSITSFNLLTIKVGYSHDIVYKLPKSFRLFLIEPTLLCLFGVDKNQLTQIAAQIRKLRPPSPYKGKGIRFLQETVRIKQGKNKGK